MKGKNYYNYRYNNEYLARHEDMGCPYCREEEAENKRYEKEQLIRDINNKFVS